MAKSAQATLCVLLCPLQKSQSLLDWVPPTGPLCSVCNIRFLQQYSQPHGSDRNICNSNITLWLSGTICNKRYTNVLEVATYLNLIVLSVFTLAGYNSAALASSLVGAVFATLVGVIIFHFARLHIVAACLKSLRLRSTAGTIITNITPVSRMATTARQVTRTEVYLREPLLDD